MAKVKPPPRPKMFSRRDSVTTVKVKAAKRATSKREEAKRLRENAKILQNVPKWAGGGTNYINKRASRLERESKEALTDVETPSKVTANVPRRSTGPSEMKQVAKVASGSVDSKYP